MLAARIDGGSGLGPGRVGVTIETRTPRPDEVRDEVQGARQFWGQGQVADVSLVEPARCFVDVRQSDLLLGVGAAVSRIDERPLDVDAENTRFAGVRRAAQVRQDRPVRRCREVTTVGTKAGSHRK